MRPLNTPLRRSTGVVAAVCAAALAVWLAARLMAGPRVRRTHTEFLFNQFDQGYGDFLRAGNQPVASEASFRDLIPTWPIDWNSCEFRDGTAIDSWGTAIQIRTGSPAIELRSAGPDRLFETSDDIVKAFDNGPAA